MSALPASPLPSRDERPARSEGRAGRVVTVALSQPISAPVAIVWDLQARPDRWTAWHPDVSWTRAPPDLREGDRFEWIWRATRIESTITQLTPQRLLAWRSRTAAGVMSQRWQLLPSELGTTVRVFAALAPDHAMTKVPLKGQLLLRRSLERWLDGLREHALEAHALA